MERQHMSLRAAQLVQQHQGRISEDELADKLAVEFEAMAPEALRDVCKKVVRALPEPDLPETSGQMAIPYRNTGWCRVPTDDGDMTIVAGEAMTGDETLSMLRARRRRLRTQLDRVDRAQPQVERVMAWDGYDPGRPFNDNADAYVAEIEA